MYAGTTRTCVSTCSRGAGTHGDVLNVHTETFLNPHTESRGEGVGHRQFCLPKIAHVWLSRASEVHQRNFWIFPISSLKIGREQHVTDSSNHSLYLIKLFSFSNLEENFGGNQQSDGSSCLSNSPSLPSPPPPTTTTTTHDTQRQGDRDTKTERDRERRQ